MKKYCLNCNKELVKGQTKYCSSNCQQEYQSKQKIIEWKNGTFNGMSGKYGLSKVIRKYMLEKANYSCQLCGWNKINPITGKSPLEIHHIDGDYTNNAEENLQVLCPNCHSLTPTYKSLNKDGREDRQDYISRKKLKQNYCIDCGTLIGINSTRCRVCEAKTRITEKPISREELKQRIRKEPFTSLGKEFNVSDKTISKWCISYGLPGTKKEIKQYSDEEWDAL